mgnify:CR=1 FL=1
MAGFKKLEQMNLIDTLKSIGIQYLAKPTR